MNFRAIIALASAVLLTVVFAVVSGAGLQDSDLDGIEDSADNCVLVPNPGQNDGDSDGYGNLCDTDVDNSCVTGAVDISLIVGNIGAATPTPYDVDDSGVTGAVDISIVVGGIGDSPGPSGRSCAACPSPTGSLAGACPQ